MSPNSNPEEDVQIGIVSYSFPDGEDSSSDPSSPESRTGGCNPRSPRIATRVSYFYEWFVKPWVDHVGGKSGSVGKKFGQMSQKSGMKKGNVYVTPSLTPIKVELDPKWQHVNDESGGRHYFPIYAIGRE